MDCKFVVRSDAGVHPEVFYRDTRNEQGYGGCSDIFDSSPFMQYATRWATREAAEHWAKEFLHDQWWGSDFKYVVLEVSV